MNIILYGTKKCADTRKAERFFRERKLPFQFRDIGETPLAEGELKNLCAGRDAAALIDSGSKKYIRRGLAFMEFNPAEELLADSTLLVTPIIRLDRKVFVRPVLEELPL
jgi:arsenate reductase-like glutaredoxin family protein